MVMSVQVVLPLLLFIKALFIIETGPLQLICPTPEALFPTDKEPLVTDIEEQVKVNKSPLTDANVLAPLLIVTAPRLQFSLMVKFPVVVNGEAVFIVQEFTAIPAVFIVTGPTIITSSPATGITPPAHVPMTFQFPPATLEVTVVAKAENEEVNSR